MDTSLHCQARLIVSRSAGRCCIAIRRPESKPRL